MLETLETGNDRESQDREQAQPPAPARSSAEEPGEQVEEPATAAPRRGPPRKLYKIGEVMLYTGLSRQTIHNYTMLGLITEDERTPSGHRLYGEGVFQRLERIQELKQTLSLKEVRDILERGEG